MKKSFVLVLILLLSLSACSETKSKSKLDVSKLKQSSFGELPNAITEENSKIEVKIEKQTYKESDKINLLLKNKGNTKITFGYPYQLEFFKGGSWYEVPLDEGIDFKMVGIILEPNSLHIDVVNLKNRKYKIKAGKYRVVKSFNLDGTEITLAAAFYLK
ncbi:immunoglobulin-like domain-containing protein [Fictibacillus barbaricus]|uniref:Bacterial Ig-like domain-containing protein n=1 Tax=Fictibacillus barbaricus TaxID=182136 RepID=A0ABS2ZGZ5_9BACL|nr:immunoglobulin-like domain-containing protein [Fictibacillus barbaricus]MBN3546598.1 hypothetical protein [Fictibacillus barbaricus]GGB42294.1 hypothetical protein GCM10007199_04490 [Fictibacillus barbaricus]